MIYRIKLSSYQLLFLAVLFFSCSVKPEPINIGRDACFTCKMTLVDEKFGAEIVTKKGKVYKFDDVKCLIDFNNSGDEPKNNIAFLLVEDYAHPGKLMDATHVLYCKSSQIKSPMEGQVAAFERKEDLKKFNAEWKGIILTWDELVTQFK